MFRSSIRGLIHGVTIGSYKYQILCLAISDFAFAGICIYFYRSFYNKILVLSIILYNISFLILDVTFYLHLLREDLFVNLNLDYDYYSFWLICIIVITCLASMLILICFNIYSLCCKPQKSLTEEEI